MTKQQIAKVKMFRAVIALCGKNLSIVGIIAAFKIAFSKLSLNFEALEAACLAEDQTTKGITNSKEKLRIILGTLSADVAAALYALAYDTNNVELLAQVHYSQTSLVKMAEEKLLLATTNIYALAEQYQRDLNAYGISATVIASLPGIIDSFSTAMPEPRIARADRKAATKTIKTLIKETDGLIRYNMDKTARLLKTDNPKFYAAYRNSRRLDQPAVTNTSIRGSVFNGKIPLYNAFILIEELGLTIHSNLEGDFDSGKIKTGICNIRVGATGFITRQFSNVELKRGKSVKLNVVLVAEAAEKNEVGGMSKVA